MVLVNGDVSSLREGFLQWSNALPMLQLFWFDPFDVLGQPYLSCFFLLEPQAIFLDFSEILDQLHWLWDLLHFWAFDFLDHYLKLLL